MILTVTMMDDITNRAMEAEASLWLELQREDSNRGDMLQAPYPEGYRSNQFPFTVSNGREAGQYDRHGGLYPDIK